MKQSTLMIDDLATGLAEQAAQAAYHGAGQYFTAHGTEPTSREALDDAIVRKINERMSDAIKDATDVVIAGMRGAFASTFRTSMLLAGIEAAEECAK